jgi:hypothetical protein
MLLIVLAVVGLSVTVPLGLKLTLVLADSVVNAPAAGAVPPIAGGLAKLNVPPRVKLPEAVTVPDKLIPLTVPVPPTLVTVPPVAPLTEAQASPPPVVYCKYVAFTVGAAIKVVAPTPDCTGICLRVPPAMLVAVVADVAVATVVHTIPPAVVYFK